MQIQATNPNSKMSSMLKNPENKEQIIIFNKFLWAIFISIFYPRVLKIMKKVQEGEKLRNISKDSKGIFSPGSKYGGKSEDLAKFKLFVEDHARGIRILHDYQLEEGHADYDASNGR